MFVQLVMAAMTTAPCFDFFVMAVEGDIDAFDAGIGFGKPRWPLQQFSA